MAVSPSIDAQAWQSPPESFALGSAEVHVWRADLDVDAVTVAACRRVLSPDEQARADRFVRPEHGHRFTCARAALRCLLGRYLGCGPRSLRFAYDAKRKPLLDGSFGQDLQFNVSHSGDKALFGFCLSGAIGVDIESVDRAVECEKLAERHFAPGEVAYLAGLQGTALVDSFFNCWTAKEAFVKAQGDGIAFGLDRFEVACGVGEAPGIRTIDGDAKAAAAWQINRLNPFAGYVASVAVRMPVEKWGYFEITEAGAG